MEERRRSERIGIKNTMWCYIEDQVPDKSKPEGFRKVRSMRISIKNMSHSGAYLNAVMSPNMRALKTVGSMLYIIFVVPVENVAKTHRIRARIARIDVAGMAVEYFTKTNFDSRRETA